MNIPKTITPELAEETGWHIGDGSMNYYVNGNKKKGLYQLRGHKLDDVEHYNSRIKTLYKSLFEIDIPLRLMDSTGVYGFQIWSNKLIDFKTELGLPTGKKNEISIPKLFLNNKELTKSIIRGIFDTDGCLYLQKRYNKLYPRIKIVTTSKKLAKQLKEQIIQLGIRATSYECKRKNLNWKPLQSIEVRGIVETEKWFSIIKPKNPKFIKKYNYLKQSLLL